MIKKATILLCCAYVLCTSATGQTIRSVLFNDPGTDNHEFVEIQGDPGMDLENIWIVEIEGDGGALGVIDRAWDLSGNSIGSNGLFLYRKAAILPDPDVETVVVTDPSFNIENGAVTLLILDSLTATVGTDIDFDNDGIVDSLPWKLLLDGIGVDASNSTPDIAYDLGFEVINDNGGPINTWQPWYCFSEDSHCTHSTDWRGGSILESPRPNYTYELNWASWFPDGTGADCLLDSARTLTPGVAESPLPTTLFSFAVRELNGKTEVSWELRIAGSGIIRLESSQNIQSGFQELLEIDSENHIGVYLAETVIGKQFFRLVDQDGKVLETILLELYGKPEILVRENVLTMHGMRESTPVYLINLSGQVVWSLNMLPHEAQIDLNHLPAGLYTIVYFHNGQKVYEKIQIF